MNRIHSLYIIIGISLVVLLASCSNDRGYKYEKERTALADNSQLGIYQLGDTLVAFDKLTCQFNSCPDDALLRVMDMETGKFFILQMDGWPTEEEKVNGRISGNLVKGLNTVTNIYLLKKDSQYAWLWAEDDGIGIVVPSTGF